jgi:alpha-D-xyloside xylohydrolase
VEDVRFSAVDGGLMAEDGEEVLFVEPWGPDAVRIRARPGGGLVRDADLVQGLLAQEGWPADWPGMPAAHVVVEAGRASLVHGAVTVHVEPWSRSRHDRSQMLVALARTADGRVLLREEPPHWAMRARAFDARADGLFRLSERLVTPAGERLYGLGQHQHGLLDQHGCVIDLVQRNSEVAIPFVLSSAGYGLCWNTPSVGRVELGRSATRWVAEATTQLDLWVCVGDSPATIVETFTGVTGRPPEPPAWLSGFWQSRLRYASQDELLAVAREYRRRGLPLAAIVIDFFHWTRFGEFRFDPEQWPDPAAMVAELESMGVQPVVSVWPTLHEGSATWDEFQRAGWLVRSTAPQLPLVDRPDGAPVDLTYYDATHPWARRALWLHLAEGYVRHGIRSFWLDACEPEMYPERHDECTTAAGPLSAVGCAYPLLHAGGVADGLRDMEVTPVLLTRSAWLGSARHGVCVWSGDVASSWPALAAQVRAGVNAGISGLSWWCSDIGGFVGGDPDDPGFRELLVRWFEFGVFSPVCRLHGMRSPADWAGGAPNEVWSFGPEVEGHLTALLALREHLRPGLDRAFAVAASSGSPVMRALFHEFPDDPTAWEVEDQFLLGDGVLVAPVTEPGVDRRSVYLPAGAGWVPGAVGAGTVPSSAGGPGGLVPLPGGVRVEVVAPLGSVPWFRRVTLGT